MPEEVFDHLRSLAFKPDRLLGALTREQFPRVFDTVLEGIYDASDPAQAARYLASFFSRVTPASALVRPFAEEPAPLSRLITIVGASAFVGDALEARPELAEDILFGEQTLAHIKPAEIVDYEIQMQARQLPSEADEYQRRESFTGALRRAQGQVMVAVATGDLAGLLQPRDVTRLLSRLADVVLDRALDHVLGADTRGLSVIAVGKLGGNDLSYGADRDVLFISDPDLAPESEHPPEYFARCAQRVIRLISEPHFEGRGYELDTRLRPSGSQGLLVTSLEAFARYHQLPFAKRTGRKSQPPLVLSSGAAWERQALLRARVAAGDPELGEKLIRLAHTAAYERGAPPAEELHRLRLRMQKELGDESEGRYDVKFGEGGILDVEFAAQWLQMQHGTDETVRTTDTREALDALHKAGYLSRSRRRALREGYEFLRTLEQRIRVFRGAGSSVVDEGLSGLEQLARRMGLRDMPDMSAANLLIERLHRMRRRVRAAYLAVLGLAESEA
jgi:glutamate-ammonia-ligase adenylyltransferase